MNKDMGNQLKGLHDKLMAEMPEGASHDEDSCPLCAMESVNDSEGETFDDQPEGGSMSDKTFTQDELNAAVEKAVADATSDLQAKLAEHDANAQQSAIDQAVAAAKAESDGVIEELQAKLDAAVLEAANEKKAREELEAKIEADAKAEEEAAALEARKEDRVKAVAEVADFPAEYVTENASRWAGMDDEQFAKYVDDLKVVAKKDGSLAESHKTTAMLASREEGGKQEQSALGSLGFFRKATRSGHNNF